MAHAGAHILKGKLGKPRGRQAEQGRGFLSERTEIRQRAAFLLQGLIFFREFLEIAKAFLCLLRHKLQFFLAALHVRRGASGNLLGFAHINAQHAAAIGFVTHIFLRTAISRRPAPVSGIH